MALSPAEFTGALLKEAQDTHPWLHHPLFAMIERGELSRAQVQQVIQQQGCFFLPLSCAAYSAHLRYFVYSYYP